MNKTIQLGNKVRVSDPCYGNDVWCTGVLENVKEGRYNVDVLISDEGVWGNRVKALVVIHTEYKELIDFNEKAPFEVGVDSGQAGIYDENYYKQYHTETDCFDDWYDEICDLTLSTNLFGTKDDKCVVSRSGFGDGGYDCFICRNKESQIVGIKIVFIEEE